MDSSSQHNPKYIFVSGGVISGIGKGIASASIAFLMKAYGLKIAMLKMDPYLNVDAGTMSPLEHGETFVLEDGFETDLDIGHYERFTGELFTNMCSLSSGRIFQSVLNKERSLGFNGGCISIDTDIPEAIVEWVKSVQKERDADVVIIEIGATVGEDGQKLYLEANRRMQLTLPGDVAHVHVSYLPIPANLGEMKSKPVQMSVKMLNMAGINPDFIIARAERSIDDIRRKKISENCVVPFEHVISAPDVKNIYEVPLNFEKDGLTKALLHKLGLDGDRDGMLSGWEAKYNKIVTPKRDVKIGIVGKYYKSGDFDLKDSYVSVIEAIKHAAWEHQVNPIIEWFIADDFDAENHEEIERLKEMDGIIVPQGWGSRGGEGKIKAIEVVRENKIPYLGLCYGMQMAVIESARNVADISGANSEEVDKDASDHVIHIMEEQREILENGNYGGTIRLGAYPCKLSPNSQMYEMYKKYSNDLYEDLPVIAERHRHRYEFNNDYREKLETAGLVIAGKSPDGNLVEAIELPKNVHPFFMATQFHPELKSQLLRPHPLFMGLIGAALEER